jgi:hypothetical protein
MGLLDKILGIKKEEINALVEGTYHDEWGTLQYKFVNLPIGAASVINDGSYRYRLYGITPDFEKTISLTDVGDLELQVEDLGCIGKYNPIERARALILKDGRIFIDQHMLKEQEYVGRLLGLLKIAREEFGIEKKSQKIESLVPVNTGSSYLLLNK